jgi:hypothetical protein
MEKPVILFSEYCEHSASLLKLAQQQGSLESFVRVCVDVDPQTKKRPRALFQIQELLGEETPLKRVPTIVTADLRLLTDKDAFEFLMTGESQKKSRKVGNSAQPPAPQDSLQAFDTNEVVLAPDAQVGTLNSGSSQYQPFLPGANSSGSNSGPIPNQAVVPRKNLPIVDFTDPGLGLSGQVGAGLTKKDSREEVERIYQERLEAYKSGIEL